MKISYFCIVNENDGNGAAGGKNYRPGQAENSPWAGRKNEVLSTTRDNKPMFNQNFLHLEPLLQPEGMECGVAMIRGGYNAGIKKIKRLC